MGKLFLILFLFAFTANYVFAAQIVLKPNLNVQMKKQEIVNKEKVKIEKKIANTEKLRIIRSNKSITIEKLKSSTTRLVAGKSVKNTLPKVTPIITQSIITPSKVTITQGATNISGIDMNRVRSTWIGYYNTTRSQLGLSSYSYDARLDNSAHDWNTVFARGRGQNHHRRNTGDAYYDYPVITEWFKNRGIVAKLIGGSTTTENVGYGYYNCNSSDCTDALIKSIRTTYDFFMSEKGKSYDAHYRSIVQPSFTKIGLDIIVVPSEYRYYLTVHYITDFQ